MAKTANVASAPELPEGIVLGVAGRHRDDEGTLVQWYEIKDENGANTGEYEERDVVFSISSTMSERMDTVTREAYEAKKATLPKTSKDGLSQANYSFAIYVRECFADYHNYDLSQDPTPKRGEHLRELAAENKANRVKMSAMEQMAASDPDFRAKLIAAGIISE